MSEGDWGVGGLGFGDKRALEGWGVGEMGFLTPLHHPIPPTPQFGSRQIVAFQTKNGISHLIPHLEVEAQHKLLQIGKRMGWTPEELERIQSALKVWEAERK